MKFKGVIFDLDGLLIDSETLYRKVSYALAESLGKQLNEEIRGQQIGRSPLEANEIFKQELGIESHSAEELMHLRNEIMLHEFRTNLQPMKGAVEIIGALHGKVKMAIATGSPRILMEEALDQLGLYGYFDHIQTSDEIARGKPDPLIYTETLAVLGLSPDECVVLEDSGNGVLAGCRAGCFVIAVPNDHTRDQDFTCASAVVDDLFAALNLIII